MEFKNLILEISNQIAIVTINRKDKLNALNIDTIKELKEIFSMLSNNDEVSAIIITGSGEKAFAAGADISELNKLNVITGKEFSENGQNVFSIIESMDKPVIAAVNGFALGGGCELALACHIRVCSENTMFAQPEVSLGLIPGYGGTQRLARLVNLGRAMEIILTGTMIDANEALKIGLVNHVYSQSDLIPKAKELAGKIISRSRSAVRLAVNSIKAVNSMSLNEGLNYEASMFALCCGNYDFKEGTTAFLEKRNPNFRDK